MICANCVLEQETQLQLINLFQSVGSGSLMVTAL